MSLVQRQPVTVHAAGITTPKIIQRVTGDGIPAPTVTTTTDINSDPNNCGTIGNKCPGILFAYSTCLGGKCSFSCKTNYADCNKDASDGCEAYLGAADNCGSCGNVCQLNHGYSDCSDDQCVVVRCDEGWYDCNGDPVDGCETNVWSNDNCGSCGQSCAAGRYCVRGSCQIDCPYPNLVTNDGRCVDPLTDPKNCGSRNWVCVDHPNADASCKNGQCTYGCHQDYADCDNMASNGCETNIMSRDNCGACGHKCGWNEQCALFTDSDTQECFGTAF
jgi:hypothetical protein